MGTENPWSDLHKILHWGDIQDVITDANFGDDRLSRFCVARGQILGFSIGFRSRSYNTLTLPCKCVIKRLIMSHRPNKILSLVCSQFWGDSPLSQRYTIANGRYCHVMYKLLYPSIRTAPPVSVRVRVRVSFSLRILFCMYGFLR